MSVLQIIYRSLARQGLTEAEVLDIMRVSQTRNHQDKVSGLMVYRAPFFVQVLEGPTAAVTELYTRISRDPRHHSVELIGLRECPQASMPTWAMGYYSPTLKQASQPHDPFVLDYTQVRKVCQALPPDVGAPFLSVLQ